MEDLKNLKISSDLHREIKIMCATNGILINEWVESVLKEKINIIKDEMDKRKM